MRVLLHIILAAVAICVAAWIVNVQVDSFWVAIVAAIVLAILNAFLLPVLKLLTLPINILTLGLFSLILNVVIIMLVDMLVPGFGVDGFWHAAMFSVVLWLINQVFSIGQADKK